MKGFLIRCLIGLAAGVIIIMSFFLALTSLGSDDTVYAETYSDYSSGSSSSYGAGTYSNETYTYAGRTYTIFEQWKEPYKSYIYGEGTMIENGCGVTSIAIIVSGYKSGEDPITIANRCADNHGLTYETNLSSSLFPNYLGEYGLTGSYVGPGSEDKVIEHLKNGNPVIVNAKGPVDLDDGTHNDRYGGHYITALGLDENGHVFIGDPGANDGTMSVEKLKNAVGTAGGYFLVEEK